MENIEFKKWVQEQIRTELTPIFRKQKFKKGRTNCYVREKNNMVQFIQFQIRQFEVTLHGGTSPIFYPPHGIPYYGIDLSPYERNLCSHGVYVPIPTTGVPLVTPEAVEKWKELKKIIIEKILYELNKISDLDFLMSISQYDVPDRVSWNAVRWYTKGVYQCRFGDFFQGVELLKKAQSCKSGYLDCLKSQDRTFDIQRDPFALVLHYVDLFCDAMGKHPEKDTFLSVYEVVCEDARKRYKL